MGVEPGIDSSDALATTLYPVWRNYADADGTLPAGALEALYREIMDRIGSHPGVGAVGVTSILPMSGSYSCDGFWPDDRPLPGPGEGECAETRIVLGDYFEAMGIRLLQGRALDARDRADAQPVVVINEALARRYWPGQDAIGKSLTSVHGGEPRQIVGVVQDVREFGPAQAAPLHIYIAYPQDPWGVVSLTLVVRGGAPLGDPRGDLQLGGEPHRRNGPEAGAPSTAASVAGRATGTSSPASDAGIAAAVRAIIREVDEDIAVDEIVPLRQVVSGAVAEERFRALLLGLFATTAILLAVIGLYGVLATIVGRRTREMGIRAALGARPTALFGLVVAEGLLLATLGLGLGLLGAVAAGRALSGFLFGVTPLDLPTYLAVSALVLGVALFASSIPARRVTRIDPTDALRRS
jgi:predicted permease